MKITIEGFRGEGKSTTAKLLAFLLRSAGFRVMIQEPNRYAQERVDQMPLDVTRLEPRDVTIVST